MKSTWPQREVRAAYHQMFLSPVGASPIFDPRWGSRLLAVAPDGPSLIISTGCAMGPVLVSVRSADEAPPDLADSLAGWEIGEEEAIRIDEPLYLGSPDPADPSFEAYAPTRSGNHRIRVLARGRASKYDLVVDEPSEEYDVTIWPTIADQARLSLGDDGVEM